FCSSRRRHTRSKRDWSSDVCSSDLIRLRDWLETYMTKIAPTVLSPKALYDRASIVRLFIEPLLGKKYIDRITTDDVRLLHETILDRKSTRLNSSHVSISYAVFCLKK